MATLRKPTCTKSISVSAGVSARLSEYSKTSGEAKQALLEKLLKPVLSGEVAPPRSKAPRQEFPRRRKRRPPAPRPVHLAEVRPGAGLTSRVALPFAPSDELSGLLSDQVRRFKARGVRVTPDAVLDGALVRMLSVLETRLPGAICETCCDDVWMCGCKRKVKR